MNTEKGKFRDAFVHKLQTMFGKGIEEATVTDKYVALSRVIRDYISQDWIQTNRQYTEDGEKQMYYFSMEFLMGRLLEMNLINTGLRDICREALAELGISLEELERKEPDPGLGNGESGMTISILRENKWCWKPKN